eukprot:TRINITY_DN11163_c0_g1_i1.p3 TRINITY_DN11163_c0_g1~~TRINITY_DN11163_c0_g1_i1.p3  ORF type:complete len:356 (+),score=21.00 TRINITY_DN11163_c0_g1_i1:2672-3739(+)
MSKSDKVPLLSAESDGLQPPVYAAVPTAPPAPAATMPTGPYSTPAYQEIPVTPSMQSSQSTVPVEHPVMATAPSAPDDGNLELPPAYADDLSCWNGVKRDRHLICALLTLGLWTMLLLKLLVETKQIDDQGTIDFFTNFGSFLGTFFGIYAMYLIECSCSGTYSFLRNRQSDSDAGDAIHRVRNTPPSIRFTIQNYHYETRVRTRSVSDGNGGTRTETYTERVRVNTHFASLDYQVQLWRDGCHPYSPPSYDITKTSMTKHFTFTPTAQQRHDWTKQQFIRTHHTDTHYDFKIHEHVQGFKKRMLTFRETAVLPRSAQPRYFWLLSVLTLSWFVRAHLSAQTGRYHYPIIKVLVD